MADDSQPQPLFVRFPGPSDWLPKLEALCTAEEVELQPMPLKSRPAVTHLHLRRKGGKGTVEITHEGSDLIVEVRKNRTSPQARELAQKVIDCLET